MEATVERIELKMPLNMGAVNCYLVQAGEGFVLIDSGFGSQRAELFRRLEAAGVRRGNLRLLVITHGDFDHIGNAAAVRERFGCPIAMHPSDRGMAEEGDMFFGRKRGNRLLRWLSPRIMGFRAGDHFRLDVPLREGLDLSGYGWAARVVELPGHSQGSVGVLSEQGELFCGDTLVNEGGKVGPGMGDPADFTESIARVRGLKAEKIYPGHGEPFEGEAVPA